MPGVVRCLETLWQDVAGIIVGIIRIIVGIIAIVGIIVSIIGILLGVIGILWRWTEGLKQIASKPKHPALS